MGNNNLIEQAQQAATLAALIERGSQQRLLSDVKCEGRTSEQRLDFRGDKLYVYTPLFQYGGNIYKEELVMTKKIFQECYKKWIESEGK